MANGHDGFDELVAGIQLDPATAMLDGIVTVASHPDMPAAAKWLLSCDSGDEAAAQAYFDKTVALAGGSPETPAALIINQCMQNRRGNDSHQRGFYGEA